MQQPVLIPIPEAEEPLWRLAEPLCVPGVLVPAGFVCDLASVPRWAWAITYPQAHPDTAAAAVVHDWLYRTRAVDRRTADRIFLEILLANGATPWKAHLMHWAVRIWGWTRWT